MSREHHLKISVIIPAYNAERDLQRAVESVCAQTYPSSLLEIIIVDDGSTDGTGRIADELAAAHNHIRVIHQPNGGLSAARNAGILQSTGEYIGFVDSDDYIDPRMYEILAELAVDTGAQMIQIGRAEVSENGEQLPPVVTAPAEVTVKSAQEYLKSLLLHEGDVSFCTKLTARNLFSKEHMFSTGRLNEDFLLMIRLIPSLGKLVVSPEEGYHVVYRSGSLTRQDQKNKNSFPPVYRDIVINADEAYAMVCESFPELEEIAMRFGLVQRLDYMLHIPISMMRADYQAYGKVVAYLRGHRQDIRCNPYLSKKQKNNLLILSYVPRLSRSVHALLMKIKQ